LNQLKHTIVRDNRDERQEGGMLQAEYPSAFSSASDQSHGGGPFDMSLLSDGLQRSFADALEEPLPEQWQSLIEGLDRGRSDPDR
jgi:hypothetical protein